jgi:hypothetical protein
MRDLRRTPMPLQNPAPPETGGEDRLSLVVPVYNEEDNVLPLVTQVQAAMAASPWPWQLILVDDGSSDRTAERIREAVAGCPERVGAVILRRNFGQTAAMQAGIDIAEGNIIATMDGDLQNNPHDIVRMVRRLLDEDLDLLVGWRRERQDNLWFRKVPSWCANRLIVAVTGVRLHDYGCSLKIFRASVIRQVRLYGEMHRFIPSRSAIFRVCMASPSTGCRAPSRSCSTCCRCTSSRATAPRQAISSGGSGSFADSAGRQRWPGWPGASSSTGKRSPTALCSCWACCWPSLACNSSAPAS